MNAPLKTVEKTVEKTAEGSPKGVAPEVETVIIGAGFSGMCMAIKLQEAGKTDFVILEKADDIGGTWRDNTYPGCACDVPSHLYSFSFEGNPEWSRMYSGQKEIWAYQKRVADKYGLRKYCRFNEGIESARFDEENLIWQVKTLKGREITCRNLISGVGALCLPAYPTLKGIENFKGAAFHSAEWNHDVDLRGKKVAVIGTGASAIQFVPEIQPEVAHLTLFQRTAPWVLPKDDRPMTGWEKWLFKHVPFARRLFRGAIWARMELGTWFFVNNPDQVKKGEALGRKYLRKAVKDPELRKKLTPTYQLGCKRVLLSNNYYEALAAPNASVETDGIAEVREHSVITHDGREIEVDAIIYGTGFKATDPFAEISIKGRGGCDLNEVWGELGGAEAYYGITTSGFPNFYMLLGPNTGLGSNSIILMIEAQVHYTMEALKLMDRDRLAALELKPEVQAAFNGKLQAEIGHTVWATGCNSWYIAETGKNTTIWPGLTMSYRQQTRELDPTDYIETPITAPVIQAAAD